MRETSASELLMTHRNPEMTSKQGGFSVLGNAWRTPTYWPCGVRCIGSVNLIWAFVQNLRTWLAMVREKEQAEKKREAESTDATARGGLLRNSEEAG
jgi:hypothetical protein